MTPTIADINRMTLDEFDTLTSLDTATWPANVRAAMDRRIRRLLDEVLHGTVEERTAEALRAIRSDDIVGRGSCSMVDEAMSDAEVIAEFVLGANGKPITPAGAVRKARAAHREWAKIDSIRANECW
jgi:hypothetical protein